MDFGIWATSWSRSISGYSHASALRCSLSYCTRLFSGWPRDSPLTRLTFLSRAGVRSLLRYLPGNLYLAIGWLCFMASLGVLCMSLLVKWAVRGSGRWARGTGPRSIFNIHKFQLLAVRTVKGVGGSDRYVTSAADLNNGLHGQIENKA